MIGRRATVGLALLGALIVCAFVAQSASAAAAKHLTTVTCVKGGGILDFSDSHCDEQVTAGTGEFGDAVLPINEKTALSTTNAKTAEETKKAAPAILKGTVFGVKTEIVCKTVSGSGTLTNEEPEAKVHKVKGTVEAKFTECTVPKPALGCKVKEPITVSSTVEGVEELGAGKNEMGLEFKPTGAHFASVVIEGCFIAGTYNIDGTAIATSNTSNTGKFSGSTSVFTNLMTGETLKLAGNAAELSSTTTTQMAPVDGKEQNPFSLTTVP